jgi:hypothetical protein
MSVVQKVITELFRTPIVRGRVAEELSIIKGFLMASIFVLVFSPFRGIIVKESTDPEKNWKFLNIADNLILMALLIPCYLCARLINRERIRTIFVILGEVVLTLALVEISLYMKADHRAVISLYYF